MHRAELEASIRHVGRVIAPPDGPSDKLFDKLW